MCGPLILIAMEVTGPSTVFNVTATAIDTDMNVEEEGNEESGEQMKGVLA